MYVSDATKEADRLTLQNAILLYRRSSSQSAGFGEDTLAMLCPVTGGEVGAGRLLDRVTLEDVLRGLNGQDARRIILPSHILWLDSSRMVWHVPGCRRPIWFGGNASPKLKAISGQEVAHPPLLFMADGAHGQLTLSVWALGSDDRPTETTPVYVAPYFNIFSSSKMCRGNVRLPERVTPALCGEWEATLYDTNFTHNGSGTTLTRFKGGHDALWLAMQKANVFDTSALLPVGDIKQAKKLKTVGEVIAQ